MHFGATLRLLRIDSGLSLRDLARRLSVSGTYLSRVENGLDSAPTPMRLRAIAEVLGVPEPLLLGVAHPATPLVVDYVREEPAAADLFLEIAERQLRHDELDEIRQFVDARFPRKSGARAVSTPDLSSLLDVDRVVVGMTCSDLDDVLDVAAGRLERALGSSHGDLGALLRAREREVPSAIGGGVLVPCLHLECGEPYAAVVTLARSLEVETPDGVPLGVVVVLAGPRGSAVRRVALLHLARWAGRGLAAQLACAPTPEAVLGCLAALDAGS